MQTHVRNGFCFGKSPVLSTDKYHIRGCVHVIIFACAACGMTQAAIALPEAAQSAVTATKSIQMASAQSAVAQTMTVQPAAVQSGVIPTQTFQPEAAQSAVVPTTTVQASAAHSSVAQTETVAPLVAQSGVAQTTTVQPPAVAPQTVPAKVTPENPGQEKSASAEPKKTWVTIDQPVKKKIVFIQFDVANVSQIGDINNIYDGLPAALAARMATSNKYLATSSRYSLPKSGETSQQQAMTQIAGETGAQFLIAGLVLNAGNGDGKRHIEVKLKIYDGFTGIPLLSRRFEDKTYGDMRVGTDKPFGSSEFFDTDFGRAINRLINTAVKGIQSALANVPFAAHIVRAEGNNVLIDAGANSLLKPGYKLVAYTNESRNPVNDLLGSKLGDVERPADEITLTVVQPQFSIGQLSHDAATIGVNPGNAARVNDADRHYLAEHPIVIRKIATVPAVVKTEPVKAKIAAQAEKPKVLRKTRISRAGARKKTPVIAIAKGNSCDQLTALRATCEKK
jgi:hypothetical protein